MKRKITGGFTLMECVIVIALIACLALLSFGNITFIKRLIMHVELDHMQSACRYLQYKAKATHQAYVLTLDPVYQRYTFDNHVHTLAHHLRFGILPGTKGPPASPSYTLSRPITFAHNKVICYPTGIMSSGTIYITDNAYKYMYALSNAVGSLSYPRKYRYAKQWQSLSS